mmetsp:Transcript_38266/g.38647  ORF Transcript_38266/g.38647 Transcript_38266/m.38647 type:complete len:334 (-) Transcript_38266:154-1155(-)
MKQKGTTKRCIDNKNERQSAGQSLKQKYRRKPVGMKINTLFVLCLCISSTIRRASAFVAIGSPTCLSTKFSGSKLHALNRRCHLRGPEGLIYHPFENNKRTTALRSSQNSEEREIVNNNIISSVSTTYSQLSRDFYLPLSFFQSSTIACFADIIVQHLEGADPIDFSHVLAMMTIAATASGCFNAYFLRKLENKYPGKEGQDVAIKAFVSTIILGGAINLAYLVGVPLLTCSVFAFGGAGSAVPDAVPHLPLLDSAHILEGWNLDEFITLTKVECLIFAPYHSIAFNFVPPQVRPLTQAGIAGVFNIIVSAVTLGYFNIWVDRALNFSSHIMG